MSEEHENMCNQNLTWSGLYCPNRKHLVLMPVDAYDQPKGWTYASEGMMADVNPHEAMCSNTLSASDKDVKVLKTGPLSSHSCILYFNLGLPKPEINIRHGNRGPIVVKLDNDQIVSEGVQANDFKVKGRCA